MNDPVVITGVGVQSAAGPGFSALAQAIRDDRACASPLDTPLPVRWAARLPHPVPEVSGFPDDRKAWLALSALSEALADARLGDPSGGAWPARRRRAVFLGTGLSSVTPAELQLDLYPYLRDGRFDRDAMARDLSMDHPAPRRHQPARITGEVARRVAAKGPTGSSTSACSASAQAIAEAFWTLRRGEADLAIVGGHDAMIHPLGLLSFVVLGALSPDRCRPFDVGRDGFLIGEGAAILVLERESHARARRAPIRGRILGAGTSADAHNPTAPHPDGAGAELAMRRALADAGDLDPLRVDYVNAHGTGTPTGDIAETRAVFRVFGGGVPMSSIKGAVGHTVAAAGAIEAAACVACLEQGFLPGTVGLVQRDPDLPVPVLQHAVRRPVSVVVSNSFGFGGQNCSLVFAGAEVTHG